MATAISQSVFGKSFPGSTGDPPVPSGDPPDGTGGAVQANGDGLFERFPRAVPVGESPTGAGESPALPIFKTRSQHRTLRGLLSGSVVLFGLLLPAFGPAAIGAPPTDDYTPVASHARALRDYESASRRWKADTNNLEASWHLGRACFDLADAATNNAERAQIAQDGIIASRRATVLDPKSAAAYYYLGLNLGQLARAKPLSAIGILDDVESAWLSSIALDPKLDHSGAHRAIGVLYRDAPGWPLSLGNRKKSLFHFEKAVEVSPDYPGNRLYLLETWIKWGKKDKARAALDVTRKVMEKAPASFTGPAWTEALADWDRRWKRIQDPLK